jgi:hypothetical protein
MDLTSTIEADSTQVNADDLAGPRVVTITGVNKGTADQPVNIELAEFPGRSYRPCKSMRRVLVFAWGADASNYIGRRMEIYNDRTVKWGGQAVGGIRIKRLSHIDKKLTLALTETRGKRAPFTVDPLPDAPPPPAPKPPSSDKIIAAFDSLGVTVEQLETRIGATHDMWTGEHITSLAALGKAIKAGETTVFEEFEPQQGELTTEADQ